jgi:hypothetical protein
MANGAAAHIHIDDDFQIIHWSGHGATKKKSGSDEIQRQGSISDASSPI